MSNRYAEGTSVPVDRSMAEIRRTLVRFKADDFFYRERTNVIIVGFAIKGVQVLMQVTLPDADRFTKTLTGKTRTLEATQRAIDDETKRLWRSLSNYIKATLDAVESGITTLEESFLAHMVLPDGQTVGSMVIPELRHMIESGDMPALMPGGK